MSYPREAYSLQEAMDLTDTLNRAVGPFQSELCSGFYTDVQLCLEMHKVNSVEMMVKTQLMDGSCTLYEFLLVECYANITAWLSDMVDRYRRSDRDYVAAWQWNRKTMGC